MRATDSETVQLKAIRRENRENPNKSHKQLKSGGSIFDANPGSDLDVIQQAASPEQNNGELYCGTNSYQIFSYLTRVF